jgi:hypothetical protein
MINEIPHEIPPVAPAEPLASAGTSSIGGTEQSLLSALEAFSTGISPTASFLSHLEMLQQANPAEFSKVETNVAAQLHDDASRAALEGNATQADKLSHVATVFESSAQSGQVPTLDALHDAGLSHDHHHGRDTAQSDSTPIPAPAPSPANHSIEVILASAVSKAIDS